MPSEKYLAFKAAQAAKPISKEEIEDRKIRPIFYTNFSDGVRCKNEKCRQYKRVIDFYDESKRVRRPQQGCGGAPIFDYVESYRTKCYVCKEEKFYGTLPNLI